MQSRPEPEFWRLYRLMPDDIRKEARQAYRFWLVDPRHNSLQFKKVDAASNVYSVRIGKGYRILGRLEGDTLIWFFIGTHADYLRRLASR